MFRKFWIFIKFLIFVFGPARNEGGGGDPGLWKPGPGAFWRKNNAILTPIQPLRLTPMYARVILTGQCAPMRHQKWCLAPDISGKTYTDSSLVGNLGFVWFFKFIDIYIFENFEFSSNFWFLFSVRPETQEGGDVLLRIYPGKPTRIPAWSEI